MEFKYAIPMLVLFLGIGFVNAATTYSSNVTFSVSVAEFIDVVITPSAINLPALNPTENGTATDPVNVTTTSNSNVPITISVSGTDFARSGGGDTIAIGNLRMRSYHTVPEYNDFNGHELSTSPVACSESKFSSGVEPCHNVQPNHTVHLWFNLVVPGGKLAGSYASTVTVTANGVSS